MKDKTKFSEDQNNPIFDKEKFFPEDHTKRKKPADFKNLKTRVEKIHIDGLCRTKHDILQPQLNQLFEAKTFEDVILDTYTVLGKLKSLGCFKNIEVFIDTSHGANAKPEGVEVTFTVREFKRLMGNVNTLFGNNEASLHFGAKAPNLFGRGERLQVDYSCGHKSSSNINISAVKPFFTSGLNKVLTASLYDTSAKYSMSGYRENNKGFLLDFGFNMNESGILKQNIQYEAVVRNITAEKQASFFVREQSGPTLKSSLRYICKVDKRDQSIFPSSGSLIQLTAELAGLGGNIGFVKSEVAGQANWSPHENITFQFAAQAGLLKEINNDLRISIVDQFFLGGPLNLRGFDIRGCGPKHDGNSVGGNTYWATAFHVYTRFPFIARNNTFSDFCRLHGFVNAGNVYNTQVKSGDSYEANIKELTDNIRCSTGCGFALKLGNAARIELNFCLPLKLHRADVTDQVQIGVGLQYL